MSVAFRRESDDEHKEPEYELPIPLGANLVTARGFRLLAAEVQRLEAALALETDEDARKRLQRQLRYFSTRKSSAEIAAPPPDDHIGIGSHVRYRLNGKDKAVTIVGHDEADPATGLIAFSAPLGRALLGAAPGELVEFQGRVDAIMVIAASIDEGTLA